MLLELSNLIIKNNSGHDAGGITCHTSNPLIKNTLITSNSGKDAGGIYLSNSSPTIINVTFNANIATGDAGTNPVGTGGAIGSWFNAKPVLINCVLWDNSPKEIQAYFVPGSVNFNGNNLSISFSNIKGCS